MGSQWASSLFGFIALALMTIPFVLQSKIMPLCPHRLGLPGLIACLGTGHLMTLLYEIQICANENNPRETNAKLPEPPLAQKSSSLFPPSIPRA